MDADEMDDIDEAILHLLQENARVTMTEIAEELPVSANTVRNRMTALEDAGIIDGYRVDVDYVNTPYTLLYQFSCTVALSDRESLADEALAVPGVVEVAELMTGERNLVIRAVASDQDGITRIARALDELGITVVDETLVKREIRRPLSYFAYESPDTS